MSDMFSSIEGLHEAETLEFLLGPVCNFNYAKLEPNFDPSMPEDFKEAWKAYYEARLEFDRALKNHGFKGIFTPDGKTRHIG